MPYEKSEITHPLVLMWSGDISAHMDQVIPCLIEIDRAIAIGGPIDIELGAILPDGSMACNAATKVSERGKL
jgi:hypothetical protein